MRAEVGGSTARAVLLTVAAVVLGGVLLTALDTSEPTTAPRDASTGGPLGSARWSVSAGLLASTDGPPAQIRTVDGSVLAVHGGAMLAIDPATGALRWSRPVRPGERLVRTAGDPAFAATLVTTGEDPGATLTGFDPATGATLWSRDVTPPSEPLPQPEESAPGRTPRGIVVTPGAVLLQSGDAGSPLLVGLDPATGEERWSEAHGGRIADADEDLAVLVDEVPGTEPTTIFDVIDLATGAARWTSEPEADGIDVVPAAQVVPGGLVIIGDGRGDLRGHDRATGETVWEQTATRRGETLTLSDEQILVTQDRTRAYVGIDAADGFVRWRHDWLVPGPVDLGTTGGRAVVASADDRVIGLALEHGSRVWEGAVARADLLALAGRSLVHADRRGRLSATSVVTGRELWSIGLSSATRINLAATDGAVVTAAPIGTTSTHEVTAWADGEDLWTVTLSRAGIGSPVLSRGNLLLPGLVTAATPEAGGPLTAIDVRTGSVDWTSQRGSTAPASHPDEITGDGSIVVLASPDHVRAYDPTSGRRLWEHGPDAEVITSPAIVDDRLVVGTTGARALSLRLDDGGDARAIDLGADPVTVAAADGDAYAVTADATLVALDSRGTQRWDAHLPGVSHVPPLPTAGTVIVTVGGLALGFDAADGRERWRADLPGPLAGAPLTAGELVLLATTDGTIRAVDPSSGETVDHYLLGPLHAGPVSGRGLVYVVTRDGELIAIGPRDPDEDVPTPPPIHPR